MTDASQVWLFLINVKRTNMNETQDFPTIDLTEESNSNISIDALINEMSKKNDIIIPRPIKERFSYNRKISMADLACNQPRMNESSHDLRQLRLKLLFLEKR